MTARTKVALGAIALAVLLGSLGFWVWNSVQNRDNEDRPPIIVRGGSLHFDNGSSSYRPGKPWYEEGEGTGRWSMRHSEAKPVRAFQLYFVSGSGTCDAVATVEPIRIQYDTEEDGNFTEYVIEIAQTGKKRPIVIGPDLELTAGPDGTADSGLKTGDSGKGKFGRVYGTGFNCTAPTQVWIESVR